jgi:peptidoglycan-N-acetylglucosamine deacetylase
MGPAAGTGADCVTGNRVALASVTFDLDTLARDFFGSTLADADWCRLRSVSFARVVPRILGWLDRVGVQATVFVIGGDAAAHPDEVREIARRGHEVANHTWSHPKNFAQLSASEVADEIRRAHDALTSITAVEPLGLRAPGYTVTPTVLHAARAIGYSYDASLVPSWSYSALKHGFRLFGGTRYRDSLFVQSFGASFSPKQPFEVVTDRTAEPAATLIEIPLTTVPVVQIPLIYGLYGRYGPKAHRVIEWTVSHRPFVALAFHDFEFAALDDFGRYGPGALSAAHTRVGLERRLDWMTASVERLRRRSRFVPLSSVAAHWQAQLT